MLSTVDLTLGFGQRTILSDINVDMQRGAVTALIGPTGSGKTTLLRTFNRMNDKVSRLPARGRRAAGRAQHLALGRRADGAAAQGRHAVPAAQPVPHVDHGQRRRRRQGAQDGQQGRRCDAIAEERLTEVGLWDAVKDRLKDSPFRLSGGQQQLLCLARALAISPDVLLLDEPTSSLDPIATESIEALLRTLVPDLTVVIVTHNLAQARRVADQTIFLNQGRLVEYGDTEQLFEHPAEEETARYVSGRFG